MNISNNTFIINSLLNSITRNPELLKADADVLNIFYDNINRVKEYLTYVITSIFENLNSMPIGIRILCKIINTTSKEKVHNLHSNV